MILFGGAEDGNDAVPCPHLTFAAAERSALGKYL